MGGAPDPSSEGWRRRRNRIKLRQLVGLTKEVGAMGRSTARNLRNRRRKQTVKDRLRLQKKRQKKAIPG